MRKKLMHLLRAHSETEINAFFLGVITPLVVLWIALSCGWRPTL